MTAKPEFTQAMRDWIIEEAEAVATFPHSSPARVAASRAVINEAQARREAARLRCLDAIPAAGAPASEAAWVRVIYRSDPSGFHRDIYIDAKPRITLTRREWAGLAECLRINFGYVTCAQHAAARDRIERALTILRTLTRGPAMDDVITILEGHE